ncbi:hypothetical protein EM20IM_03950 [Candidatus Methylacidiphilum infernorum]|uniref:Uncharacterized protein n=1 Tax=Candidatus Methylacidiphilum infernorum TaxID=511746 RepID=A0ABX7PXU9_9BACT|nr:hypothetical protein [Candidatus Methylacidiphilum infernorum]QSR87483.1 hypothetical protein EM20IM_03950 [Candidatus Methylacidiphilum infernorum]
MIGDGRNPSFGPPSRKKQNRFFSHRLFKEEKNLEAKTRLVEEGQKVKLQYLQGKKSELISGWLIQNQNPFPNPCFLPKAGSRPTRNVPREAFFPENKSQVAYPMRYLFQIDHPSFDCQWRKNDHEKDLEG